MKKRIVVIVSSLVLVLAVAAAVVFFNNRPSVDKPESGEAGVTVKQASSKELDKVSLDSAIDIALEDAGIKREDAVLVDQPSLDEDDKKPHYDIDFKYGNVEYEYEIAVDNGAVIKAEKEKEKPLSSEKNTDPIKPKEDKKESEVLPSTTAVNVKKEYISVEKAKEIALKDAGVKKADAVFKKAYHDSDDLVAHFDIKFVAGGYEYEYEIKASDGAVLERDIEKEPVREQVSKAPEKELISEEEAKEIAIAHANIDPEKAKAVRLELDRDDMIVHYDVEFVEGRYEYEYEINAETGKIIAHDKDFDD